MSVADRRATPSLLQIDAILGQLSGRPALAEVGRFLRAEFAHFAWFGVYRRTGDVLELLASDGDAAGDRSPLPVAEGGVGRAVREGRTVRVDDVARAPESPAPGPDTRAQLAVPIRAGDRVVGAVAVDGRTVSAFDASDARFVEAVAARIAPTLAASDAPPG